MFVSVISLHDVKTSLHFLRELPLVWFFAGCSLASAGLFFSSSSSSPQSRLVLLRRIAFAAGVLVLVVYVVISLYSLGCFMVQQDEANILSISAASLRGLPVYNPPRTPDSNYSLMYGPFTFLIYRIALILGGVHHFWVIRATVVAANLGLCVTLYALLRKLVSSFTAIALLTFPISVLLQHDEISLSARADIWIMLFAALAILCSFIEVELPAIILTGVMGGILIGLKISAAPAILFPLLMLYRRFGFRAPIVSSLIATVCTLIPFALSNISLHNYISWILFTRSEGISAASAFSNILFALFLMSPCLLVELFLLRFGLAFKQRIPEFFVILFCLFIAVLTSKNGSGPHYLWHILPSLIVYLALASRNLKELPLREQGVPPYFIAVACMLFAGVNIPRAYEHLEMALMPPGVKSAQQSIDRFLDIYGNHSSIQMGYGSAPGDYRPLLRYILIYKGQPYTIEGSPDRFETALLPFPVNVLNRMGNCKNDVWLVPHSQQPFQVWVLPNILRSTFIQNYKIVRSDAMYDAWICNRSKDH